MAVKGCVCVKGTEMEWREHLRLILIDFSKHSVYQSNKLHVPYVYVSVPKSRMTAGHVAPETGLMCPLHLNALHPPQVSTPMGKIHFIQSFTQIATERVHAGS